MFGKKKNKPLPPGQQSVMTPVRSSKEGKVRLLRVTVFPKEGGRPYVADVQPDEQGTFEIGDKLTYQVSRGSVWEEQGVLRTLVNEGNPKTISAFTLVGDDSMDPTALHGIASNNLWIQLDSLAKRKSLWKSAGTWGLMILGIVVCLLMLWNVKTTGDGFENIKNGLDGLQSPDSGLGTDAEEAGHQPIAPGSIVGPFSGLLAPFWLLRRKKEA